MSSEPPPKFRLVRCPNCRNVLPEVADVPLYKCGGCSTVLQAKSRRNSTSSASGIGEASAALDNGSDNLAEKIEMDRLNQSTLDGSEVSNLPGKEKENGGNDQNKDGEFEGEQHGSVTLKDGGQNNGKSIQSQPQPLKCERPETNLPSEDREDGSYQAKYEGCRRDYAKPSPDTEQNARDELEMGDFSEGRNDQKIQNRLGDFEVEQHGSTASDDEGEKNYGSGTSSPQEVKYERPEVTHLSGEDTEIRNKQGEHREFSRNRQGYIYNEHPRVANSSSDRKENGSDENELRECNTGVSGQNKHGLCEGEHHGSMASEDECEKNYRSGQSKLQEIEHEMPECTYISSKYTETGSDQDEYGECSGEFISNDHLRVANSSLDGKENGSNEYIKGDCRRGLLKERDDMQPWIGHPLRKENIYWGNQNRSYHCNGEPIGVTSSKHTADVNIKVEEKKNVMNQNDSGNCEDEQLGSVNELTLNSQSVDCDSEEISSPVRVPEEGTNGDTSLLAAAKLKAKAKGKSIIHSRNSSAVSQHVRKEVSSPVTAHREHTSTSSSDTLVSSLDEELEKSQRDQIRSVDTIPSAEIGDQSSEFTYVGDPAKFYNRQGSHVYDGSISSYDGNDNYLPDRQSFLHNTYEDTASGSKLWSDKRFMNTRMNKSSEMQRPTRNSMSIPVEKNTYSMRRRQLTHDEYSDPTRPHHPVGHLIMQERENNPYVSPFYQKGVLSGYESSGPSEFQSNTSRYMPAKSDIPEQERIKLLQKVYELLDQLKTADFKGISAGGVSREDAWRGRNLSEYSCQVCYEGQNLHDLRDQRYCGRYRGESNLMKGHKISRIPYSGEVTYDTHYTNHPNPADWRYSAPLPPLIHNQYNGMYSIRPGSYSPYSSYVSSPPHFMDSYFPQRSGEVLSDEEIRGTHITKNSKAKHLSDKRHFLPSAGGAPFVTCHCCLNLLQIPAEFLPHKGRLHMLKCGSCSKLLKFSLKNRGHLVQYTEYMDSPTSASDELNNDNNANNVPSTFHGKDFSQVYPLSDSGNYGNSLHKNCSQEDAVPVLSQSMQGKTFGKKSSNKSSLESRRQHRNSVRTENRHANAGKSDGINHSLSNKLQFETTTPENEELPASCSPLHRLMGYSSPRHVIHGSGTSAAREASSDEDH